MCRRYLVMLFVLFCSFEGSAQYDQVWAFGGGAGLDFSTNPPSAIQTAIATNEGSASICDSNGLLLFYTDGTSIWDRNNQLMPNGTDLPGAGYNITSSTSQGALVVPMPGDQHKYYVFSMGEMVSFVYLSPYFGKLYYSIVDMNLNNGWGDVVAGSKGILLDTFLMEQMTAVTGNQCNTWLMVATRDTTIKAFNIDRNGIGVNPVLSKRIAGENLRNSKDYLGNMILSPDRNKLVLSKGNLVLYDFDPESGRVLNPLVLSDFSNSYYGAAFSSDNAKLYASSSNGLDQYDLAGADPNLIMESRTAITPPFRAVWSMRLGPDGKIYIASAGDLSVINKPDLRGTACDYVNNGLTLSEGTRSHLGMPNYTTIATSRKVVHVKMDTAFCTRTYLLAPVNTSGWDYLWEDGSTNINRLVDRPGVYWVKYETNPSCLLEYTIDTIKLYFDSSRKLIRSTTDAMGLCPADTVLLVSTHLNGTDYLWSDGIKGKQRIVDQPGTYALSYQVDSLCRNYEDRFVVTYADPKVSFIVDTIICQLESVPFFNTSDTLFKKFEWSFGDNGSSNILNPEHVYPKPGRYSISLKGTIDVICQDVTYLDIEIDSLQFNNFLIDKDSICVGESINFSPQIKVPSITSLNWVWGSSEHKTFDQGDMQHAFDSAGLIAVQLYTYFRACPSSLYTDTVRVFALPNVDLGADTAICNNGKPIVLSNHAKNDPGNYHLFWSTGDTTASVRVTHHGSYSLTLTYDPLGCSTTEFINVKEDCYIDIPNAFTPNGDGFNDYFFPRQYLSKSAEKFEMWVFNRWGQVVYATKSQEGRGWDGRLNGKELPQGTYLYRIQTLLNEKIEQYQGNVTLIR